MFLKKDCKLDEDGQTYLDSHNYSALSVAVAIVKSHGTMNWPQAELLTSRLQKLAARI